MKLDLSSARRLIVGGATSNGLTISDADADAAAQEMSGSIAFDTEANAYVPVTPDGARMLKVVDGRAVELDLAEHVLSLVRRFGKRSKPEAAPELPAGATKTQIAMAQLKALRDGKADAARAAAVSDGNPWSKATFNRTRQALITKHNPDLAAELRRQAGK